MLLPYFTLSEPQIQVQAQQSANYPSLGIMLKGARLS